MRKYIHFIFYITLISSASTLYPGMRDLIIVLDWHNERIEYDLDKPQPSPESSSFGPTSYTLINAIAQKAAPILVTAATWKNYIQRKQIYTDFITLDLATLKAKYKNTFKRFNTESGIETFAAQGKAYISPTQFKTLSKEYQHEIETFLWCFLVPFDTKEWIVEKFGNYFYLLIPKTYLEAQRAKKDYPEKQEQFKKLLSDQEKILGLKQGELVVSPLDPALISAPTPLDYQKEFLALLPKLFVTKNEVSDPIFLPHWYIYFVGHGGPSQATALGNIAGLTRNQFKQVLLFLNNKIQTDFLYYTTCFVGGEHLIKPYEETWFYPPKSRGNPLRQAIRPETYNYIIIAGTLIYAPTSTWWFGLPLPFIIGSSSLKFSINFPSFFQSIKDYFYPETTIKPPLNLMEILKYVQPSNIPVIRYPGTEWFSSIDIHNKVERLSRVLVETHEAEGREIVISNKELIIIDPMQQLGRRKEITKRINSEILVPIRIKKDSIKNLPTIISSANAPASHYFEKIMVIGGGLVEFIASFFRIGDEFYGRTYYIKKLLCKNDLTGDQAKMLGVSYGEPLELNNVIIVVNDRNPFDSKDTKKYNGIYFSFQSKNFAVSWPADDKKTTALAFQQAQKGQFPWIAPLSQPIPPYPFALPEIKYKNIVGLLQQKIKGGPAILQKELAQLADKLATLNKQLAGLKH